MNRSPILNVLILAMPASLVFELVPPPVAIVGASANVVSAGISAAHGRPISFGAFARYGIPLTLCQLILSAVYELVLQWMISR